MSNKTEMSSYENVVMLEISCCSRLSEGVLKSEIGSAAANA